jgi:hypothetical protein
MRLKTAKTILFTILVVLVAGAVPLLTADFASAWVCDFVTGGGWIQLPGAKANFGVGGGCKKNGPDAPFWGHLNYLDHGSAIKPVTAPTPFHVHWTSITGYFEIESRGNEGSPKIKGTRDICGKAVTNDPLHMFVDFHVRVTDNGEPGSDDIFWIRLADSGPGGTCCFYDTGPHDLGDGHPGGGNIQLHKPNPSNEGDFGGTCGNA